ncbi:MAG: ABC transporter ATP-binding protein [Candidatus Saccharibacteria bacterium]
MLQTKSIIEEHSGATPRECVIKLQDVSRVFQSTKGMRAQALKDMSLDIDAGEIVAITGPSGSGKSTLLQLIGGLDRPTKGEITVAGHNLSTLHGKQLAAHRNRTIGFVFQFFYLQPFLTVRQNIEIPMMFAGTTKASRATRVESALQSVGLDDRMDYMPAELSGGQMQRAAIARAIIMHPTILLADEPTGNLDSTNSKHILELLSQIRDAYHTTIVVVTHDSTVAAWADRTIHIVDGEVA